MKKNNVKKVTINFIALILASTTFASVFTFAGAKHKVKNEPWVFMSTEEVDANWDNLSKDVVYVEKSTYKIANNKGDGYNKQGYYACFKYDRYKGKKLKKGMKVTCYFLMGNNPDHDCTARVDFYKNTIVYMSDIQP